MNFVNETEKQAYYIAKCKEIISNREKELGRKLKACVATFGCQMNFKDSEKLIGILNEIGYEETEDEHADLVLYNTCTKIFIKNKKRKQQYDYRFMRMHDAGRTCC